MLPDLKWKRSTRNLHGLKVGVAVVTNSQLLVVLCTVAGVASGCGDNVRVMSDQNGSIILRLETPTDVALSSAAWTFSKLGLCGRSGILRRSEDIRHSFTIEGIPPSSSYEIRVVAAAMDNGMICNGAQEVDITAGSATVVTLTMRCFEQPGKCPFDDYDPCTIDVCNEDGATNHIPTAWDGCEASMATLSETCSQSVADDEMPNMEHCAISLADEIVAAEPNSDLATAWKNFATCTRLENMSSRAPSHLLLASASANSESCNGTALAVSAGAAQSSYTEDKNRCMASLANGKNRAQFATCAGEASATLLYKINKSITENSCRSDEICIEETCVQPKAIFVTTSDWNLPLNNPTSGISSEPNFSDGTSGWGLQLTSSFGTNSINTVLRVSNNTCQRSNGIGASTFVKVYIEGTSGTRFQVKADWNESASAFANPGIAGVIGNVNASTLYSSLGYVLASSIPGHGEDAHSLPGREVKGGWTSGSTIESDGVIFSLAQSYRLTGYAGSNGQCFTCDIVPGCCDCGNGIAMTTATFIGTACHGLFSIDNSFIAAREGGRLLRGYVPKDKMTDEVIDMSGVTIATGVDLGQWMPAQLASFGLRADLVAELSKYAKPLHGRAADDFLKQMPLRISASDAIALDNAIHNSIFRALANHFDAVATRPFCSLPSEAQTAIADLALQYGDDLPGRTPRLWSHIVAGRWSDAVAELRNFGDNHGFRRNLEADLLERAIGAGVL